MNKIKLIQLFTNPQFTLTSEKEKISFKNHKQIKPYIKIDDTWHTLTQPIKHINIIFDHILQTTEIELTTTDKQVLLTQPIDTLEETIIQYEEQ